MAEPEEQGATRVMPDDSEPGQWTEGVQDGQTPAAGPVGSGAGQQSPDPETAAPGDDAEGSAVVPTTTGADGPDEGAATLDKKDGALRQNGPEPSSEENDNLVPAAEQPEAENEPSQEPGTATAETDETSAAAADEETPVQGGEEEQDAAVEDVTAHNQPGDTDVESTTDQPTEQGPAEDATDEDEAASEGKNTPDDGSEAGKKNGRSSAGGSASPGSADSGGSSLTRLVERSSLEQQYRALLLLRRQLLARSQRIQQRLSQHFSRKTDDNAERVEKNVGELEARYNRYLNGIREQQRFTTEEQERRQQELAAFRAQVERQTELVSAAYSGAVELRRQVALKSRSSRTGRLMAPAEVETLIGREQQKELEVQEARLESLRRETRLTRLEQTLRESEELAGGIHLIDFEQLKIENQTYAEKIEERNEDLTKLRRKIASTVQILTHLKERIQFEQAENERREEHLETVSAEVTGGRESLAQLKQRRDQVRSHTASQRATAGLLGHEALLRDFETRVDEEARLVRELHALKRDYADNQRMTQAIRHMVRTRRQQQQQQQQGRQRAADGQ